MGESSFPSSGRYVLDNFLRARLGYSGAGTLQDYYVVVLPRCTRNHTRSVRVTCSSRGLGVLIYRAVYDVSSRDSFDALPRWYSELETYVSNSVVKILVGNKLDKVRLVTLIPDPCPVAHYLPVSRTATNRNSHARCPRRRPSSSRRG
jgi:hypothetical protein